jgi:hypothetical protein
VLFRLGAFRLTLPELLPTIFYLDRETRALDGVISEELSGCENLLGRRTRNACDAPDEARKKQKTLGRAASARFGGPVEGFVAPQDIGNVAHGKPLSEPLSTRCVAFDPT